MEKLFIEYSKNIAYPVQPFWCPGQNVLSEPIKLKSQKSWLWYLILVHSSVGQTYSTTEQNEPYNKATHPIHTLSV